MFGRLLGYMGPLWIELKPAAGRGDRFHLGAILVNLTGAGNASRTMSWGEAGPSLQLRVRETNLGAKVANDELTSIEAGVTPAVILPWIPLMQGGGESGILERWKACAGRETDARRRSDYGGLTLVFAEAGGCRDVWKSGLKEWNVTQSKQVLEWQEQARSEGRVEGRVEGRAEGTVEAILKVLATRFGAPAPEVAQRIRAVRDQTALDSLLVSAARSMDLPEFLRDLPAV